MVERFYSGDFDERFAAVCDEIDLPFWGISAMFDENNCFPFVYFYDNNNVPKIAIGNPADTHNDVIAEKLRYKISRSNTLCGRIWNNKIKIITIWEENAPKHLLTAANFKNILNLLKKKKIDISNAKLIFEASETKVMDWLENIQKENDFYIFSIPISEYISHNLYSFDDVIKLYNSQEKKKTITPPHRKEWEQFDDGSGNAYLGYHLMTRMDESKQPINENVLIETLPDELENTLLNNTTSLGNNPAIPDIFDVPFLLKIANNRFDDIKRVLLNIGEIDDFEDTEINSMLSKLINKCKEIERPYRNELEKLCVNFIIDTFNVPEDAVQLNVSLVDNVDLNNQSIIIEPLDGDDDFQFDDVNALSNLRAEIYKRRILDALCMGESIVLSSDINSYAEKINKISPELCELYLKIIALNNYSLFTSDKLNITDKDKKQIGTVTVELGNENEQVRITAQGEIFPILLSETIRGFMELFISHGLPKDKKIAMAVINKSDFLKAEPWDMRLGPSLWLLLSKSFNDITLNELPYLLKRIASLNVDNFNFLMKEVFAKTKKGKQIMSKLCAKAKNDIEYERFTDRMSKMKIDKSIITDEYIGVNEL